MFQDQIKDIIERHVPQDGLTETGIIGVQLFRATQAIPCAPVVYEPSVIAIASGSKEAVFDGTRAILRGTPVAVEMQWRDPFPMLRHIYRALCRSMT